MKNSISKKKHFKSTNPICTIFVQFQATEMSSILRIILSQKNANIVHLLICLYEHTILFLILYRRQAVPHRQLPQSRVHSVNPQLPASGTVLRITLYLSPRIEVSNPEDSWVIDFSFTRWSQHAYAGRIHHLQEVSVCWSFREKNPKQNTKNVNVVFDTFIGLV